MTQQDKEQLKLEIDHIFESGANEIRIFEMVENFIDSRSGVNENIVLAHVSGQLPLAEIEDFIWEIGEDYHLWDEERDGQYPVKRTLEAIQKWFTAISKRQHTH